MQICQYGNPGQNYITGKKLQSKNESKHFPYQYHKGRYRYRKIFGLVTNTSLEIHWLKRGGDSDLGRMANLKLVDKRGKELVELKLQVLA
jgi:hypothetical protein